MSELLDFAKVMNGPGLQAVRLELPFVFTIDAAGLAPLTSGEGVNPCKPKDAGVSDA